MEANEMFINDEGQSSRQIKIKFQENGSTEIACIVKANTEEDDIYKIKKRLLKKLN